MEVEEDDVPQQPESLQQLVRQTRYKSNAIDGVLGFAFLFSAMLIFSISLYAFIISKFFMPYTGNRILDWIKDDEYYCCLIPSTMISSVLFMYINWVAMKYFRHS